MQSPRARIFNAVTSGTIVRIDDGRRSATGEIAYTDETETEIAVYTGKRGRPPRFEVTGDLGVYEVEDLVL